MNPEMSAKEKVISVLQTVDYCSGFMVGIALAIRHPELAPLIHRELWRNGLSEYGPYFLAAEFLADSVAANFQYEVTT